MTGFAKEQLLSLVSRIEHEDEIIKVSSDKKRDTYAEAKANGFDVKALKYVVSMRRKSPDEAREQEAMISVYLNILGYEAFVDGEPPEVDRPSSILEDEMTEA